MAGSKTPRSSLGHCFKVGHAQFNRKSDIFPGSLVSQLREPGYGYFSRATFGHLSINIYKLLIVIVFSNLIMKCYSK